MTDKPTEPFSAQDFMPTADAARPATLSELEDLLMDAYETAQAGGTGAAWKVFSKVEAFVFDHVHFAKERT